MKSQSYDIQDKTSERLALTILTGLAFLFVFLSPIQALTRDWWEPLEALDQEDPATHSGIDLVRKVIPGLERPLPR